MSKLFLKDDDIEIHKLKLLWASYIALKKLAKTTKSLTQKIEFEFKAIDALNNYFDRIDVIVESQNSD